MMKVEGRGVQSIEVGGRILSVLAEARKPLMLRDLAAMANMAPGQAHAYLVSYRKLEMVEQDAGGLYQLGAFALQLGVARMRSFNPLRLASAAVGDLARQLGLMVTTAVWGTHGPTIVEVIEGGDQVHVNLRAGTVYSISGTATGKVFAAFMPEKVIQPHLAAEMSRREGSRKAVGNPTALSTLKDEIAKIRLLGYGTAEEKPVPGINGISAPVYDHTGQMQLAITIVGVTRALSVHEGSPEAEALLAFTNRLSAQNGYQTEEAPVELEPTAKKKPPRKQRTPAG